jgi:hypothetical protein
MGVGLACALPFIGWFGMLPFLVILSLGAFITGLFYKEHPVAMPVLETEV